MIRDIQSKIKTIDELSNILDGLRNQEKKIICCHGVFDLLHPGHIRHFEAAKKKGDVLTVTITKDQHVNKGPGRPVFNHALRAESIAAIECVDYVAINEWPTAIEAIKKLKPHFYVKGSDYADKKSDITGKIYDEEEAVRSVGGTIHFTDEMSFSSTALINSHFAPYPKEAKEFLADFKKRYAPGDIINLFRKIESIKALVIGDVIIDEYHYCTPMGKSPKSNIVPTKFLNKESFAGGVLAASNHLAGFLKDVTLASTMGTVNKLKDFALGKIKPNIRAEFIDLEGLSTVVKRRFVEPTFLTKLFEVCYLEEANHLPASTEKKICEYLDKHLEEFDMVLVADFGHGIITPTILELISKKAKFLAVNAQSNSSNMGFNLVTKFPRADYICIDEPELRLACHDKFSDLEKLIQKIAKTLDCGRISITRGHKGSLVYSKDEGFTKVPVFSERVLDTIGAGDAYLAVTAPCVFKNMPMEVVGFIGNAVGAMEVLIVGNRSAVEPVPLFKYIQALLK